MTKRFLTILLTSLFFLTSQTPGPARAQDGIALEISGAAVGANLSLVELDALPQETFTTSTIWTDDMITFSGVSLKTLLEAHEATGHSVEMIALNDYSVTMPISELGTGAPIVATRMNGEPMSVREKGPYWIVFPYDTNEDYQTEIVYSRSIWQLNRLVLLTE